MKNVFKSSAILLLLVLSSMANAKINVTYSDYDGALGHIKLDNACKTKELIKTVKPVEICTELVPQVTPGNGDQLEITNWVCAKRIVTDLAVKRAFQRTVCTEMKYENETHYCSKTELQNDFIPDTVKTSFAKNVFSTSTDYPGTVKYVEIKDCAQN